MSDHYAALASLFFETRQIIRAHVSEGTPDPNRWLRCEVLRFVASKRHAEINEIASFLRVKAPTATVIVRSLEVDNLVMRRTGEDRRTARISLTEGGRRELLAYRRTADRTMRSVFSRLSAGEVSRLSEILSKLIAAHRT